MKFERTIPVFLAALLSINLGSAQATFISLIDFGRSGSQTSGDSPKYNNISIGNSGPASNGSTTVNPAAPPTDFASVYLAVNGGAFDSTSTSLVSTSNSPTGVSITVQAKRVTSTATSGAAGSSASGGDYSGTVAPVANALFANTATGDGLYVNRNAVMRVILSGLNNSSLYDLSLFSGRSSDASGNATWNLVSGVPTTSQFQIADGTIAAYTGQALNSNGANGGIAIQWLSVSPVGGQLIFDIALSSPDTNSVVGLNALAISLVPEPSSIAMLAFGMISLWLFRRR